MRTTARMRTAASAASPTGSAGSSSTVHPESGSLSARERDYTEPSRSDATDGQPELKTGTKNPLGKKSRGKALWGVAREGTLAEVDADRNPDANTFRPNGAATETDAYEALIRKRDPLRGKKVKLASYCKVHKQSDVYTRHSGA